MEPPNIRGGSGRPVYYDHLETIIIGTRANRIIATILILMILFAGIISTTEQDFEGKLLQTFNLTKNVENLLIHHGSNSIITADDAYINKYDLDLRFKARIKVTEGCINIGQRSSVNLTNKLLTTVNDGADRDVLLTCWYDNHSDTFKCCKNEIERFEKITPLNWPDNASLRLDLETRLKMMITNYNSLLILSDHDQNLNRSEPDVFPKIGLFDLQQDSLVSTSSLQYNPNLAKNRIFDEYVYLFSHQTYNYIILNTYKDLVPGKRASSEVRIARICKNDTDLNSYIELKLTCDGTKNFNANSAFFIGTILYVIYEKRGGPNEDRSRATSHLCSFAIGKIDTRFLEANERCHFDRSDTSVQLLTKFTSDELNQPPGVCKKMTKSEIDYCSSADNPHIDGTHIDFRSTMHRYKHASFKFSRINFIDSPIKNNESSQTLILGTATGYLVKLHTKIDSTKDISTRIFFTIDLSSGSIKYGSDEFQYRDDTTSGNYRYFSDSDHIIALSENGLARRLPKDNCGFYTTCHSCFFYKLYDPLRCNWCGDSCTSDKCTSDYPQDDTCHPKIKTFSPKKGPITGGTRLRIHGDGFGTSSGELMVKLNDRICHLDQKNESYVECITEREAGTTKSTINITVIDVSAAIHSIGSTIADDVFTQYRVKIYGLTAESSTNGTLDAIIYGENLDVGSSRSVLLGNVTCDIISVDTDRLGCRLYTRAFLNLAYNRSIDSLPLKVYIDEHEQELDSSKNLSLSLPVSALKLEQFTSLHPYPMGSNQPDSKEGVSFSLWIFGLIVLASFAVAILSVHQGMILKVKKMAIFQSNNPKKNAEATNRNECNSSQQIEMSEPLSGNELLQRATSDAEYPLAMNDNSLRDRLIQEGIWIERNRFHFLHQLGEGQFGKVFKGLLRDNVTGKEINVAIKTLHNSCSREDNEAFLEEGTMMKNFKHENVLTLIGITLDSHRGSPMIITPFMMYGDLRTYVKEEEPNVRQLLDFGLQVARGMAYLAEHNFLHRDLAARNCMLDENLTVKVADFGLARPLFYSDYYRSYNPGLLPIKWMAPESISESRYTEKSDVWSYGVLLWELMARGLKPYPDLQPNQLQFYLASGNRMLRPSLCPVALYKIMLQCWDMDANARPTFTQLVERVSNVIIQLTKTRVGNQDYDVR